LKDVGHIGHAAARRQVGQDDDLVVGGQDVGALGHKVLHAAKDDELGFGVQVGVLGQLVAVAPIVRVDDDFIPLVVVPQNHQSLAQGGLGRTDAGGGLLIRQLGVFGGEGSLVPGEPAVLEYTARPGVAVPGA